MGCVEIGVVGLGCVGVEHVGVGCVGVGIVVAGCVTCVEGAVFFETLFAFLYAFRRKNHDCARWWGILSMCISSLFGSLV